MKLSRASLLKGANDPKTLNLLLDLAEKAFKTWQPTWSPFITGQTLEKIKEIITPLDEIKCIAYGGFIGAERKRVVFTRKFNAQ